MKNFLFIVLFLFSTWTQAEQVEIKTSMGEIRVELLQEKSPITVANFLSYVDSGFYDGLIFHRVINNFMIQTGGFNVDMQEQSTLPPIQNESNNYVRNDKGTLAMARTANPNSASSQFYINHKNNNSLNYRFGKPGYAVFGQVVTGMNVIDLIAKVKTGASGRFQDVPVKPVIIESIQRVSHSK